MALIRQVPNTCPYNAWNSVGGSVQAVENDWDAYYLYVGSSGGAYNVFGFPTLPADAVSPLTSCVYGTRFYATGAGTSFLYLSNGNTYVHVATLTDAQGAAVTTPSNSLVVSTVNAATSGVQQYHTGATTAYCYYLYREAVYSTASAPFISLIYTVGPLLFGASLLASDFAKIGEMAHAVPGGHVRFSADEIAAAQRDYRDYRFPRHIDLGRRA